MDGDRCGMDWGWIDEGWMGDGWENGWGMGGGWMLYEIIMINSLFNSLVHFKGDFDGIFYFSKPFISFYNLILIILNFLRISCMHVMYFDQIHASLPPPTLPITPSSLVPSNIMWSF